MQKRKLTKIFVAVTGGLFAVNAFAIGPGLYMGLMMGPASNDANPQPVQIKFAGNTPNPTATTPVIPTYTQIGNPKSTQFGSRAYLGYKFNQYAGFELGFTYFSGINFILSQNPSTVSPATTITVDGTPFPVMTPYQSAAGTTGRVRLVDLLGKLDYSYNNTIGLFVKGGVAAAYVTVPGGLQPTSIQNVPASTPTGTKLVTTGSNKYLSKLAPAFAIGASYDLNQSWQVDISWTRYFVGSQIKSMNLYGLGLSYHFVDVYCGSFLCGE